MVSTARVKKRVIKGDEGDKRCALKINGSKGEVDMATT
jgi:hypothetical protein